MELKLPHDAWVFVGDGRKALLFRNGGDELYPNLIVEQLFEQDNPATSEQGTDRPGRYASGPATPRSGFEATDWHEIEEHRFAKLMADRLDHLLAQKRFDKLVIVAPPAILGSLRKAISGQLAQHVIAEVDKTLTNHPPDKIEKVLTGK